MNPVRIGQAGIGYWGSKLARNVDETPLGELAAICDASEDRLAAATKRYPHAATYTTLDEMLADESLDAVVLATPAASHAEHAEAALRAGKHVLVEKPLALTAADCARVVEVADREGLALMVGHTFLYSEPVRVLRHLITSGELGDIAYIAARRLNLGIIREDLNAWWNFGPHDISILLYLVGQEPERVSARQFRLITRASSTPGAPPLELEDVAFVVVEFGGGVVAHVHESWLDPRKVRDVVVVGSRKMAVYDDTDVESPLRIYDKGVDAVGEGGPQPAFGTESPSFGEFRLRVRAGDMLAPRVTGREPLSVELEHFCECVGEGRRPLTDGHHGAAVVRVLEAADRSAAADGQSVSLHGVPA
jgi:predicted dehydrogenase